MPNTRLYLILGLMMVSLMIWMEWEKDYGRSATPAPAVNQNQQAIPDTRRVDDLPSAAPSSAELPSIEASVETPTPARTTSGREIRVTTDVLDLRFDTEGAQLVESFLLDYPVTAKEPGNPVTFLHREPGRLFVAQTGLFSADTELPNHQTVFEVERDQFELGAREQQLEVPFSWTAADGSEVRLVYTLERGSYLIHVRHEVSNRSGQTWSVSQYRQMQRTLPQRPGAFSFTNPELYSFAGAAAYSPEDKFQKLTLEDFASDPYSSSHQGGWIAMLQHYFLAAWVPDPDEQSEYRTAPLSASGMAPRYLIRSMSPLYSIETGQDLTLAARFYVGPKLQATIGEIAPGLELTVNYGIFTILSKPLFWLLDFFHSWVGNWGVAIILVTVLIKLAFFKLTETQYRSMARMRKIQPRLMQLKERFGDDRQKLNAAMMEMYKKEKINPLGGCLPILIQIPVFIALYWVLLESVELRQAPFFAWIQDLSSPDPYFILPVINAVAMFMTQRLSPTPGMDPMQQKVFQAMPLIFAVMFAFFPAGLVLYWTVNGVLSLAQQYVITKRIDAGK